jgi:hypothetical protein
MKLLQQEDRWSCLPTSLAMVLDLTIIQVLTAIGHDGSEIIYPDKDEPFKRRGFHLQEIVDAAYLLEHAIVTIEGHPILVSMDYDEYPIFNQEQITNRLGSYLFSSIGILTGRGKNGNYHAVAWNGKEIYDPTGPEVYSINDFIIESYNMVIKIKSIE